MVSVAGMASCVFAMIALLYMPVGCANIRLENDQGQSCVQAWLCAYEAVCVCGLCGLYQASQEER